MKLLFNPNLPIESKCFIISESRSLLNAKFGLYLSLLGFSLSGIKYPFIVLRPFLHYMPFCLTTILYPQKSSNFSFSLYTPIVPRIKFDYFIHFQKKDFYYIVSSMRNIWLPKVLLLVAEFCTIAPGSRLRPPFLHLICILYSDSPLF